MLHWRGKFNLIWIIWFVKIINDKGSNETKKSCEQFNNKFISLYQGYEENSNIKQTYELTDMDDKY